MCVVKVIVEVLGGNDYGLRTYEEKDGRLPKALMLWKQTEKEKKMLGHMEVRFACLLKVCHLWIIWLTEATLLMKPISKEILILIWYF